MIHKLSSETKVDFDVLYKLSSKSKDPEVQKEIKNHPKWNKKNDS